jgi:hypothetical protein
MTRQLANLCPVTLLAAMSLAACASAPPPYATNMLAWPRAGESVNQFQADDLACRTYMQAQAAANHSAVGAIAGGAQSPSDVAYAQCMTSKGYSVENTYLIARATAPLSYGYANSGGP